MLKRLATAGVLTVAVGGVLMSATPALAGGDEYYKYSENNWLDLDFRSDEENEKIENETFAFLNCLNVPILIAQGDQNCYIGNVAGD